MKRALLLGSILALVAIALSAPAVSSAKPPCSGPSAPPPPPPPPPPGSFPGVAAFVPSFVSIANDCKTVVDTTDDIFLCYSKFQVDPGHWAPDQAADLLSGGYWYPNAVPGNVPGGTNLGDYHLMCNAPGTPTGDYLNLNGEVVSKDVADDNLGYYPIVSS